MSENAQDLAQRSLKARKFRDAALILPLLGIFLFLTPIPAIFKDPAPNAGIPSIFMYIYGGWLALIIISAIISSRITANEKLDQPDDPTK